MAGLSREETNGRCLREAFHRSRRSTKRIDLYAPLPRDLGEKNRKEENERPTDGDEASGVPSGTMVGR